MSAESVRFTKSDVNTLPKVIAVCVGRFRRAAENLALEIGNEWHVISIVLPIVASARQQSLSVHCQNLRMIPADARNDLLIYFIYQLIFGDC